MRAAALVPLVVLAAATSVSSRPARAEHLAVVVGNNVGQRDDVPLRFAEDDAVRVGDALVATGGFPAGDVAVLRGAEAGDVRRAVLGMNERLRRTPADDSTLVVYYSGHADARALHTGDSTLPLQELEQMVRSSAARFRVLIVDACRSGVLTRTKGGRAAAPVDLAATVEGSAAAGEGFVILTSAAAGEDAQESDALQGSFFTHHLVSALLGAADADADDVVTLAELYRYAWEHTIRDSSETLLGVQHPGYRYDLRGSGDIVLARLRTGRAWGLLRVPPDVVVFLLCVVL
jgi:hypothetical protein